MRLRPNDLPEMELGEVRNVTFKLAGAVGANAIDSATVECDRLTIGTPLISGTDIDGFDAIVSLAETPILAFCRTGTRCTTLWALSQASELDNRTILETAAQAGYDLSGLVDRLDQRRG